MDDVRHYLFQTKDLFLSKDKQASKNSGKYINDIIQNYGSNIAYQILQNPRVFQKERSIFMIQAMELIKYFF